MSKGPSEWNVLLSCSTSSIGTTVRVRARSKSRTRNSPDHQHVHDEVPGTGRAARLEENAAAADLTLSPADLERLEALAPRAAWRGDRQSFAAHRTIRSPECAPEERLPSDEQGDEPRTEQGTDDPRERATPRETAPERARSSKSEARSTAKAKRKAEVCSPEATGERDRNRNRRKRGAKRRERDRSRAAPTGAPASDPDGKPSLANPGVSVTGPRSHARRRAELHDRQLPHPALPAPHLQGGRGTAPWEDRLSKGDEPVDELALRAERDPKPTKPASAGRQRGGAPRQTARKPASPAATSAPRAASPAAGSARKTASPAAASAREAVPTMGPPLQARPPTTVAKERLYANPTRPERVSQRGARAGPGDRRRRRAVRLRSPDGDRLRPRPRRGRAQGHA